MTLSLGSTIWRNEGGLETMLHLLGVKVQIVILSEPDRENQTYQTKWHSCCFVTCAKGQNSFQDLTQLLYGKQEENFLKLSTIYPSGIGVYM